MSSPGWQPILRINYGLELTLDVHDLPGTEWIVAWRRLAAATQAHGWELRDSEAEQAAWIGKVLARGYHRNLWDAWRPPSGGLDPSKVAGGMSALYVRVIDRLRLLDLGLAIGSASGFRCAPLAALDWALAPQFSNPYEARGEAWLLPDLDSQRLFERVACRAACLGDWPHSGLSAALDSRPRLLALLRSVNCPAAERR
jgi:hypothetical protein